MPSSCHQCGSEIAAEFAFCGVCGAPIVRGRALPIALSRDGAREYESDVETTLDLRLQNVGERTLRDLLLEVTSPSLESAVSREWPQGIGAGEEKEFILPGFRPPRRADALLLNVSVLASPGSGPPIALAGEFKVRIRRANAPAVNIINISGDKNIVDQARFGGAALESSGAAPTASEWLGIALHWDDRRLADLIAEGTPLVVRNKGEELEFRLGAMGPVCFGRKKESNNVVIRIAGDDQRSVNAISRNHFTLEWNRGRLHLKDQSTKGTSVNGRAVAKEKTCVLSHGDVIVAGEAAEFRIQLERVDGKIVKAILDRVK